MQSITSSDLLQLLSGGKTPAVGVVAGSAGGAGTSQQSLKSFLQLFSQQFGTEDLTGTDAPAVALLGHPEAQQIFSALLPTSGNSLPQEITTSEDLLLFKASQINTGQAGTSTTLQASTALNPSQTINADEALLNLQENLRLGQAAEQDIEGFESNLQNILEQGRRILAQGLPQSGNPEQLKLLQEAALAQIKLLQEAEPKQINLAQDADAKRNPTDLLQMLTENNGKLSAISGKDTPTNFITDLKVQPGLTEQLMRHASQQHQAVQTLSAELLADNKHSDIIDELADIHELHSDSHTLHSNSVNPPASKFAVSIPVPMSKGPAWQQSFGEKVVWLVNQKVPEAELKINPPHLGPLEIKISVNQDQASVVFSSQNHLVRETVESAIPRLREMLGDNGLNLANVDVSDKSFANQRQTGEFSGNSNNHGYSRWQPSDNMEDAPIQGIVQELNTSAGVVDYYA
jgi:flagellar hook-length control protein FliK